MDVRYNINKIDTILKENFNSVSIVEKSSQKLGKYFEISVKESKEVKFILPFKNIDGKINFEFQYLSNPLNESSELIPRMATLENLEVVIKDIINNNRFDKEYLKS
jgi:hypothetical protein